MTEPPGSHPQGGHLRRAGGTAHFTSLGMDLRCHRQERPGERAKGARRRQLDGAAPLRGRSAAVIGPVGLGERWSFTTTTTREPATSASRCRPLPLRTPGVGLGEEACEQVQPPSSRARASNDGGGLGLAAKSRPSAEISRICCPTAANPPAKPPVQRWAPYGRFSIICNSSSRRKPCCRANLTSSRARARTAPRSGEPATVTP